MKYMWDCLLWFIFSLLEIVEGKVGQSDLEKLFDCKKYGFQNLFLHLFNW